MSARRQNSSTFMPVDGGKVLLFGASGTIGHATYEALVKRGYSAVCPVRTPTDSLSKNDTVLCDLSDIAALSDAVLDRGPFDAVISCIAARSGTAEEAWAVDHDLNVAVLELAKRQGIQTFVLLSAICVQKPKLQFQSAKLAFEKKLADSGVTYSIVRPTALFKSLSGQIERVRAGKPYLLFGNGQLTACKPIADVDLANYLIDCIKSADLHNRILPIGGPGPAITPLDQGRCLFELLDMQPKYRHIPVAVMTAVIAVLSFVGRFSQRVENTAELARIGHYYATESMLVLDPETQRYDPDLTPSYGTNTLFEHYRRVLQGDAENERVDTAFF